MPKVSVIVPVYNVEQYLRQCLDSLVNQTLNDIEIVCINDGSTDGSLEILKEYSKKDSRIIFIDKKNEGVSAARNKGLDIAKGEYVVFCDGDDYYEPSYCTEMYDAITTNKDVDLVLCDITAKHEEGDKRDPARYRHPPYVGKLKLNGYLKAHIGSVWHIMCCIFNKEVIDKYKLKFPKVRTAEDTAFLCCYLAVIKNAYGLKKALYTYRLVPNSTMANAYISSDCSSENPLMDMIIAYKYISDFLKIENNLKKNWIFDLLERRFWVLDRFNIRQKNIYLENLNKMLLSEIDASSLEAYRQLYLCKQHNFPKLYELRKKIVLGKDKKISILGITIYRKKVKANKKKYYIFGIRYLTKKIEQNIKKYYLFGVLVYKKRNSKVENRHKELTHSLNYTICFDSLRNIYVDKDNAWFFFQYLQSQNIPSKFITLDPNLKGKDIVYVSSEDDFLLSHVDLIANSQNVVTSYGLSVENGRLLKSLTWLKYIFIEHGVCLFKKGYLYKPDRFDAIVAATKLTKDFYIERNVWPEARIIPCGLSRWDMLRGNKQKENTIFVFFTYRRSAETNEEQFVKYENSIKKILLQLKKICAGTKIVCCFHHNLAGTITFSDFGDDITIISENDIPYWKTHASMCLTDYSSMAFEFMYQDKPVIFYRFDYFDSALIQYDQTNAYSAAQEDDKLYNVFYDEKSAMDKIEYYVKHNFELEERYKKINKTIFWEQENCCSDLYRFICNFDKESQKPEKYYIVSGGFDPIHEGHIEMIKASVAVSDGVIVLVNSDEWLCRKKGKNFHTIKTRKAILENLKGVIDVLEFDDSDNSACDGIRKVRAKYPNAHLVFANGGDRKKDNIPEVSVCKECNVDLAFGVGGTGKTNSSSWILEKWNKQ